MFVFVFVFVTTAIGSTAFCVVGANDFPTSLLFDSWGAKEKGSSFFAGFAEGDEEGDEEGVEEGIEEGDEEGVEEGDEEGIEEGDDSVAFTAAWKASE